MRHRGSDDQNGAQRRQPKKIKTTKKTHPTAHDQKTIIPRLTPFWPLNGLNPPKRFPTSSNWTGFFTHAPGHLFQALTASEPPKRALPASNGICAQGHPNDICLLCVFVFLFLLFISAGVPFEAKTSEFQCEHAPHRIQRLFRLVPEVRFWPGLFPGTLLFGPSAARILQKGFQQPLTEPGSPWHAFGLLGRSKKAPRGLTRRTRSS